MESDKKQTTGYGAKIEKINNSYVRLLISMCTELLEPCIKDAVKDNNTVHSDVEQIICTALDDVKQKVFSELGITGPATKTDVYATDGIAADTGLETGIGIVSVTSDGGGAGDDEDDDDYSDESDDEDDDVEDEEDDEDDEEEGDK